MCVCVRERRIPNHLSNKKGWIAQILIEMDRQDEKLGKIEEIFSQLHSAYSLLPPASEDPSTAGSSRRSEDHANSADLESMKPGMIVPVLGGS